MSRFAKPRSIGDIFIETEARTGSEGGPRTISAPGAVSQTLVFKVCIAACMFFLCAGILPAQQTAQETPSNSSPVDLQNEVRALSETVRQLQSQVQSLNSQLSEILAKDSGVKPRPDATAATPSAAGASGRASSSAHGDLMLPAARAPAGRRQPVSVR